MIEKIGNITSKRFYRNNSEAKANNSIEATAEQKLPDSIGQLITGSDYWIKAKSNRYKKLIRDGFEQQLLELAKMAQEKNNPANWFAKVASKAQWDRTMDFLKKLLKVTKTAADIAKRVGAGAHQMRAVYKVVWNNKNALLNAIKSQEIGKDKFKYFCWLSSKAGQAKMTHHRAC